jgi:hypothetical protein
MNTLRTVAVSVVVSAFVAGCGGGVNSDERARQAYTGLDKMVEKAMNLGFKGFNEASSANIAAQTANGDVHGTVTVNGQVDQGASANKGMRLSVGLVDYSDGDVTIPDQKAVDIDYATVTDVATQPGLTINLKSIPNGTMDGSLNGTFNMAGDVDGDVTLALSFTGAIEDDGTGKPRRKAGTTKITGTATSGGGTYNVDVTR